jgi:hypothetical protein
MGNPCRYCFGDVMIEALSWIGTLVMLWAAVLGFRYPRSLHLVKACMALIGAACFLIVVLTE